MSNIDISVVVEQIQPNAGDILAITVPESTSMSQREKMFESLSPIAEKYEVAILLFPESVKIKCLNEEEMNDLGWYRKGTGPMDNVKHTLH